MRGTRRRQGLPQRAKHASSPRQGRSGQPHPEVRRCARCYGSTLPRRHRRRIGEHEVVRRSDHRGQVIGGVTNRGKRFKARHGIRVPCLDAVSEHGSELAEPGAASGEQSNTPAASNRTQRCSRRRSAGEMAEHAFPFRQLRRRRRQPSEHRSERSEQSNTAMFAPPICRRDGGTRFSVPSAPTKTAATQRTSQRAERAIEHSDVRAADLAGEMAEHAFRSVSSDEDGGDPANIAASGASNRTQRCSRRRSAGEMAEHAFPFRQLRRRRRRPGEHRSERSEQSNTAMFAPPICRRDGGTRLSVPSAPTKTAATRRTSQRAERAIEHRHGHRPETRQ